MEIIINLSIFEVIEVLSDGKLARLKRKINYDRIDEQSFQKQQSFTISIDGSLMSLLSIYFPFSKQPNFQAILLLPQQLLFLIFSCSAILFEVLKG